MSLPEGTEWYSGVFTKSGPGDLRFTQFSWTQCYSTRTDVLMLHLQKYRLSWKAHYSPTSSPKHTVKSQPVRPLHPGGMRVRLVPTPTLAYRAGRWHSLFILVEILREGISLTSQDCLEEVWAQEKLYSSFMIVSILRSVPELYHNSKWVNKESTLVGKSQGPCRKAKLFDRSLKQTLLWEIICMSWWRDSVF